MSYTTQAQIETRISKAELIRLTDEDDTGTVDAAKIEAAIEAAGAEIDSYLGSRYALPLAETPGVIGSLACDIAIYTLYALDEAGSVPETRQKRYDSAVKLLAEIETGDRTLGRPAAQEATGEAVVLTSDGRIFSRDKLRGW